MTDEPKPGQQWKTTTNTRERVLSSARAVFAELGYAEASIGAIVERSGVSVGSIYHHFGGKAALFDELWHEYTKVMSGAARSAAARERSAGCTDPAELFIAAAEGYLESLTDPDVAELGLLFRPGSGPPGFDAASRRSQEAWIRSNAVMLGLTTTVEGRLRAAVVTGIIAEGEMCYLDSRDPRSLAVLSAEVVRLLQRVLAEPPERAGSRDAGELAR